MKPLHIALLLLVTVVLSGCTTEPQFSKVSGIITKNGKPMNLVEIRFVPLDETLGKFIGKGTSDAEGRFTIAIPGREEDVCCTGKCKVTLRNAPAPDDVRSQLMQNEGRGGGGNALKKYKASLKNRSIPTDYERLHSTPLLIDVGAGEFECNIEL